METFLAKLLFERLCIGYGKGMERDLVVNAVAKPYFDEIDNIIDDSDDQMFTEVLFLLRPSFYDILKRLTIFLTTKNSFVINKRFSRIIK